MPLYEYLCPECNVVYQFLSRRMVVEAPPVCPHDPSHLRLERQMSRFAFRSGPSRPEPSSSSGPEGGEQGADALDDPRVERRMMDLMERMESVDENDGRAMGRMMRELADVTGEGRGDPALEETIRRLEAGEDPEDVEAKVGDAWGEEAGGPGGGGPSYDSSIYDM